MASKRLVADKPGHLAERMSDSESGRVGLARALTQRGTMARATCVLALLLAMTAVVLLPMTR